MGPREATYLMKKPTLKNLKTLSLLIDLHLAAFIVELQKYLLEELL